MQKTLLRQLTRSIGITDEETLARLLSRLDAAAATAEPDIAELLCGFSELLARIEAAYEQYEHDLELRTRRQEISSHELSELNEKLRQEIRERDKAIAALRDAVSVLLPNAATTSNSLIPDEADIDALSHRLTRLVADSENSRRELEHQKFALDQHAIVSITDAAGNIVYANDRFCELSEYRRDELIGKSHRLIKSGEHSTGFFENMWETITQGHVWHGEVCNRSKSGRRYWVNATVVPLPGPDGLPEQYISIRTDITDRKNIEARLFEQLHLIEELIEAIPLPMYLKNAEGRYQRLNRAFELFFDIRREDYIGRTLHDLLLPEDAGPQSEKDRELLTHAGTQSYEAVVHTRDGTQHDVIYRKAALTQIDGTVQGLLGVVIEISDRKQAEREVLLAKEVAEAANRAKSEFLANMSHEIRTPMNGIIGMTELALDTELNAEQREYMTIVKSSSEALLTIINDILDFSRIEAGKLLVEHIPFNLPQLLAETLKTFALRAHEKNVELTCEILPDVPAGLIGDPNRIRQILINLVGNAVKFTESGEISLRVERQDEDDGFVNLHFSVRDTGIGIAPENQRRIFEAFSQEDSSTTRRYGGTGLGLSISRRLVDLMGGRMWLESELHRGSTFHFSLHLESDVTTPSIQPDHALTRGRRVLVVDDNETNRRILAAMLADWEIEVLGLASASAARQLMQNADSRFDAILLDAHMPDMDGYQLADELRRDHPDLPPMLMLSSGTLPGDAKRSQQLGIAGFFSKPVSSEELLGALCHLFSGSHHVAHPAEAREKTGTQSPSLSILLAEDHPVNQKLAIGLLEKWGHRPILAANGQEALVLYAEHPFDIVLMDLQMPVMNGIEATRRIRHYETQSGLERTPIIAMTASAMQGDREACLAAGMDDYISKPVRASELSAKLQTYAGQPLPDATAVFDYGAALGHADPESMRLVAEILLDNREYSIERLRTAMTTHDTALRKRIAHGLHGPLSTLKAEPAARIVQELAGDSLQEAAAMARVEALDRELSLLAAHLEVICDRPKS